MSFAQTRRGSSQYDGAMCKIALGAAEFFYSGLALLNNGTQAQVACVLPAYAIKRMKPLRHARPVERCHPHAFVSGRVYPRAESVHRFVRVAGLAREGRCRRATKKPTYGQGCAMAAASYKRSLSCDPQSRVTAQWMLNTCVTSARTGGAGIEFCKYSDIRATRFTWVPASAGSSGCSARSSATEGRSLSITPAANTCSALLACSPLIVGALPQRKAVRPAPHLPNRRGNGRCAILPRQQRNRTRKQSRPAPAGRAVA